MASGRFVPAQELTRNPGQVVKGVNSTGEPCYITEDGKAKAVIMDINQYNALMDLMEEHESPKHETDKKEEETRQYVRGITTRILKKKS